MYLLFGLLAILFGVIALIRQNKSSALYAGCFEIVLSIICWALMAYLGS